MSDHARVTPTGTHELTRSDGTTYLVPRYRTTPGASAGMAAMEMGGRIPPLPRQAAAIAAGLVIAFIVGDDEWDGGPVVAAPVAPVSLAEAERRLAEKQARFDADAARQERADGRGQGL